MGVETTDEKGEATMIVKKKSPSPWGSGRSPCKEGVSVHDVDGQLGKSDAQRDDFYIVTRYMIH